MKDNISIRATDARDMLGYAGRNSVTNMAKNGEIPGAFQDGPKGIWKVPLSWVQERLAQAGDKKGPGKPRGYSHQEEG